MILGICDNPDVLKVMRLIDIIITIIKIAVPIILIVSLMLDYLKAVKDDDNDALAKANRLLVPKIITCILIFLIPTFVKIIALAVGNDMAYTSCIKNATKEGIEKATQELIEKYIRMLKKTLTESNYNILISEINKLKDESAKNSYLKEAQSLHEYVLLNEKIQNKKPQKDSDEYNSFLSEINKISDSTIRNTLTNTLNGIPNYGDDDPSKPGDTPGDNPGDNPGGYKKTGVVEEDSTRRYHINGYNKLKFYLYNQCEGNWSSVKLRNGETDFCGIGCGLTTQTVLISAYKPTVTPYNSLSWGDDNNHDKVIMTQTNNSFTCQKYSKNNITKEDIKKYLSQGYVASLKVWGSSKGESSPFTSSQHFMALIDYYNNEIFVGNSYNMSSTYGKWGWFNADAVLSGFQEVVICKPKSGTNPGGGGNTTEGSGSFKKYTDTTYSPLGGYYLYTPKNATSNMPLVVAFPPNSMGGDNVKTAMEQKISNLKAYVYIPLIGSSSHVDWTPSASAAAVKKIKDLVKEYKINESKISLTAFSSSGWYIYQTANDYRIFSAIAPISSGMSIDTIKTFKNWEYLKTLPMKGYGEKGGNTTESGRSCTSVGTVQWSAKYAMCSTFEGLGKCSDCNNCQYFTYLPEVCHGEITKYVFNIDYNNNGVADILDWMIKQ